MQRPTLFTKALSREHLLSDPEARHRRAAPCAARAAYLAANDSLSNFADPSALTGTCIAGREKNLSAHGAVRESESQRDMAVGACGAAVRHGCRCRLGRTPHTALSPTSWYQEPPSLSFRAPIRTSLDNALRSQYRSCGGRRQAPHSTFMAPARPDFPLIVWKRTQICGKFFFRNGLVRDLSLLDAACPGACRWGSGAPVERAIKVFG